METIKKERLTLEEKLRLLTAAKMFTTESCNGKLPTLQASDGPHGLRIETEEYPKGVPARCYPSAHVLANSWNVDIAERVGRAIASDCVEAGIDLLLAPGVNIKRTPLCGRNFEYFSEDPVLAGEMAKRYVTGVQAQGVGTSVKHFCANNREWERMFQSSEVDERTLMEIYVQPFAIALEAQPWTVMCAYNPVNGVYASENPYLLNEILRGKLGYDGVIVSDWGAVHDRAKSLKATLDIEFPYAESSFENLSSALKTGEITEAEVDESVDRILRLLEKKTAAAPLRKKIMTDAERDAVAEKGAAEGIVLLKNDGVLPLKDGCKALVVGDLAENPSCYGGGSARVIPKNPPMSLSNALKQALPNGEFPFHLGYVYASTVLPLAHCQSYALSLICKEAAKSDVVIIAVGTNQMTETEVYDRTDLRLPRVQEKIILSLAEENKKVIVVVEAGSAVDMTAWADKVAAIVYTGFAGEKMNVALAKILSGQINPSGKLSETFPLSLADTPTGEEVGNGFTERYKEATIVGYRHYDYYNMPVLYPFGFGLSYTSFAYSDLQIEGWTNDKLEVSFTLKNEGETDGAEVVQLYVEHNHAPVERAKRELKKFKKVFLAAGESKRVKMTLEKRDLAFYSTVWHKFTTVAGEYGVAVGASSRDIRLHAFVTVE